MRSFFAFRSSHTTSLVPPREASFASPRGPSAGEPARRTRIGSPAISRTWWVPASTALVRPFLNSSRPLRDEQDAAPEERSPRLERRTGAGMERGAEPQARALDEP